MTASPDALRQAPLYRVLHALAKGETSSEALTGACLAAIARDGKLSIYVDDFATNEPASDLGGQPHALAGIGTC